MAAYEIAAAGFSALMVERRKRPGAPFFCAEGVGRYSFENVIKPKPEWISTVIDGTRVIAPDGSIAEVRRPRTGYILDREKLDCDLADRAVSAGCRLECETIGTALSRRGDCFETIELLRASGEREQVDAGIFIAADGVESRIGRRAGIENIIDYDEVESLLEYRVENISVETDTIEFYVGSKVAPKGYLWVFPKSLCSANIGLGVISDSRRGDITGRLLDDFIGEKYPDAVVTRKIAGLTPKFMGKGTFRLKNLLAVGDAARALDSLTGAGIVNAMMSGKMAGEAAAAFLSNKLKNLEELDTYYPGRFLKKKAEELSLYLKLHNVYKRLNDEDFIDIIKALNDYINKNGTEGINAGRLLAGLIKTRPRLIRLVRYLI